MMKKMCLRSCNDFDCSVRLWNIRIPSLNAYITPAAPDIVCVKSELGHARKSLFFINTLLATEKIL